MITKPFVNAPLRYIVTILNLTAMAIETDVFIILELLIGIYLNLRVRECVVSAVVRVSLSLCRVCCVGTSLVFRLDD